MTEVCRAAPGSRVRSEAGPCRRSASSARRAGGQSHDALFRSEAGLALPESRGSAKAPARRARDAQPSRSVSHTPAALRSRVPSTPSMWNSVSFRMCFLPALQHPRQHCDVLAHMCIACALHTRSSAHTTRQPCHPSCAGDGTGLRWSDAPLHLRPVRPPGRLERQHHRGGRRPPPLASLAASPKRHRPRRSRSRSRSRSRRRRRSRSASLSARHSASRSRTRGHSRSHSHVCGVCGARALRRSHHANPATPRAQAMAQGSSLGTTRRST